VFGVAPYSMHLPCQSFLAEISGASVVGVDLSGSLAHYATGKTPIPLWRSPTQWSSLKMALTRDAEITDFGDPPLSLLL
jgi:hypothetical protein